MLYLDNAPLDIGVEVTFSLSMLSFQIPQPLGQARRQSSAPRGLSGDANMVAVPLFRVTNMAAVTSSAGVSSFFWWVGNGFDRQSGMTSNI